MLFFAQAESGGSGPHLPAAPGGPRQKRRGGRPPRPGRQSEGPLHYGRPEDLADDEGRGPGDRGGPQPDGQPSGGGRDGRQSGVRSAHAQSGATAAPAGRYGQRGSGQGRRRIQVFILFSLCL